MNVDFNSMSTTEIIEHLEIYSERFHPAIISAIKGLKQEKDSVADDFEELDNYVSKLKDEKESLEERIEDLEEKLDTIKEALNE